MTYDADSIRNLLTPRDRRRILEACGFRLKDKTDNQSGVLGPKALGEGEKGNFSVDLERGLVKDFGSSGYQGDIFDVVRDVQDLDFPEVLAWIVETCGLRENAVRADPSAARSTSTPSPQAATVSGDGVQRGQRVQVAPNPSSGHSGHDGHAPSPADTKPPEDAESDPLPDWDPFQDGEEIACYEYVDAGGAVQYENVRFEPTPDHPTHRRDKTFRQRAYRPDHPKADRRGFAWGRHGTPLLLYRLPQVREAAAEGRVVFVVEGEKDVHTLESWGFVATTTGSATSWDASLADHLRGARLVLLPDNDADGRAYARQVAQDAHEGAHFVRWVTLPGVPAKGDVTDWKARGGTKALLQSIVQETPNWTPEVPGTPTAGVHNVQSVQSAPGALPEPAAGHRGHAGHAVSEQPENPLALDRLSPIPDPVYDDLPGLLGASASEFTYRHERDVYLTGALGVLSGCLPSVRGYYGHQSKVYGPHFYAAVVAGAGAGKGTLTWAKALGRAVHAHRCETSEAAQARWASDREQAQDADLPFDEPEPPTQSLYLPANASASALHRRLKGNDGRAVLFETEIDTLLNALGQEWGKFDDTLRKASHHETVSYLRNEEEATINDPHIAAVLSGTDGQFQRLIGSAENGLYSRFALYYFRRSLPWISQQPSPEARQQSARFKAWGEEVLDLYRRLQQRTKPLWIRWEDGSWEQHQNTFAPMKKRLLGEGLSHLESIIHRAGLMAFRISMVLTVLRADAEDRPLDRATSMAVATEDVNASLRLACVYADHALRFAQAKLPDGTPTDPQSVRIRDVLRALPEDFTNADVYAFAEQQGWDVSRRTLRRDLQHAASQGLVESRKQGQWRAAV